MSILRPSDDSMHYADGSHRWTPPRNISQNAWEASVRAHLAEHVATMGGQPAVADNRDHLRERRTASGARISQARRRPSSPPGARPDP